MSASTLTSPVNTQPNTSARRALNSRHADGVRQSRVHAPPLSSRPTAAPNKQLLDIEDVLRWAYRDELPKRRSDDGELRQREFPSVSPMFSMAALGGRVENFSREPGFPAAMGEPHPDALLVEAAVERLARYAGHEFQGELGLLTNLPPGQDEHAAMRRAMGQLVDTVRVMARLGHRPTFTRSPEPAAVIGANGRVQILVVRNGVETPCGAEGRDRYPSGAFCQIVWDRAETILLERADYAAWWAGLDLLAHELAGTLDSISVLPPAAAQRPWAGEVDQGKPRRLLDSPSSRAKVRDQQETELARRLLAHRRRSAPQRPKPAAAKTETTGAQAG